jgi:hypothetical protein
MRCDSYDHTDYMGDTTLSPAEVEAILAECSTLGYEIVDPLTKVREADG